VRAEVRANGFARSKTHLQCNLGPSPLSTDHIKASLFFDQLDGERGHQRHVYVHHFLFKNATEEDTSAFSTLIPHITYKVLNQCTML